MITKAEILDTWNKLAPIMADAPKAINQNFVSTALRTAAARQKTLEMDYAAAMLGLCAQLPGELEIIETIDEELFETTWRKGGVTVGRLSRIQHNVEGEAFSTDTAFELTAVGTDLVDNGGQDKL